ncbi:hypothetical protein [Streptomyces racemochromogenes]|uniref:hypothetical protein n=1 Tax=Streptomyces racemochromogenes TaxID=67353 RepID=UPI0031E6BD2B
MDGRQDKRQEPGKGSEVQEQRRPGEPAQPQPGRSSREKGEKGHKPGQKEASRRREDDLLREEDLHDEGL